MNVKHAALVAAVGVLTSLCACGASSSDNQRSSDGPSASSPPQSADTVATFFPRVEAVCLATQETAGSPSRGTNPTKAEKIARHGLPILHRRVHDLRALHPPFAVAGTYREFLHDYQVLADAQALALRQMRAIRAGGHVPASQFRQTEKQLPGALTNLHLFTQTNRIPACGGLSTASTPTTSAVHPATTQTQFQRAASAACLVVYRGLVAPARVAGNNTAAGYDLEATGVLKLSASVNAAPHPPGDSAHLDQIRFLSARFAAYLRRNAKKLAAGSASRSYQGQSNLLQRIYLKLGLEHCLYPSIQGAPTYY